MWYYPAADLKSWDFLPSASGGGVVVLDGEVANVAELGAGAVNKRWSGPNGRTVVSNSQLREVSPRGELRRQYIQGCSGPVSSYNAFAHEVRESARRVRARKSARARARLPRLADEKLRPAVSSSLACAPLALAATR